jgi:hypothetical protein
MNEFVKYKIPVAYPIKCKGCFGRINAQIDDYYGMCFECYLEKIINTNIDPYYEPHKDKNNILFTEETYRPDTVPLEDLDRPYGPEVSYGDILEDDYSEESYP